VGEICKPLRLLKRSFRGAITGQTGQGRELKDRCLWRVWDQDTLDASLVGDEFD
jgi:hypothetical protein